MFKLNDVKVTVWCVPYKSSVEKLEVKQSFFTAV